MPARTLHPKPWALGVGGRALIEGEIGVTGRIERKIEIIAEALEKLNIQFDKIIKLMEKKIEITEQMHSEHKDKIENFKRFFEKLKNAYKTNREV